MNALSIVILSYNRRDALRRTLTELGSQGLFDSAEIIVADNASTDGSAEMVRDQFPGVRWLASPQNSGVQTFNSGAALATGEYLLLLDDDSWPDSRALPAALELIKSRAGMGGVALLPKHPRTNVEEWSWSGQGGRGGFVRMGCGNLLRMEAWRKVGGYESDFFLYRNDTDLALKLLAAGYDVWFDPSWIVWHDSPAAARKSERWLRLATRNWGWLARRHGRGPSKWLGMFAGFVWASRLAGFGFKRQAAVLAGVLDSFRAAPPRLSDACKTDGSGFARLVQEQIFGAKSRGPQPTK